MPLDDADLVASDDEGMKGGDCTCGGQADWA